MLSLFIMLQNFEARLRDDEGQGLAEYALILVFIAIVAIAALTLLGGNVSKILNSIATKL